MNNYVVHPGYVTIYGDTEPTYYDAGTLAALYGLEPGEYDINTTLQQDSMEGDIIQVHLFPRPDNKYQNIKTLYGDNGTEEHVGKMIPRLARRYREQKQTERRHRY